MLFIVVEICFKQNHIQSFLILLGLFIFFNIYGIKKTPIPAPNPVTKISRILLAELEGIISE